MAFLSNKIVITQRTSTYVKYKIVVTIDRTSSFFAINPATNYIAVKKHDGTVLNYIGWPKASSWPLRDASTGNVYYPRTEYKNGQTINPGPGSAQCVLLDNFVYESSQFQVNISKGNKRKGSTKIIAGADSKIKSGNFAISPVEVTLETTETANPEWSGATEYNVTDTDITISRVWSNPDSYYTARIIGPDNTIKATNTNGNLSVTLPIEDSWYGTVQRFYIDIIGKDNATYKQKEFVDISIPKKGFGIYAKKDNIIRNTERLYFKNVSNKEPKEVWVKVNGKIYQTEK